MDVNIENIDFGWKHATAILNVLKSILHYPTNPQRKAKLLDNTIFIIFESLEEGADTCNIDGELWDVFLYIASCIPPGHPWQDSLLQSLNNLRQRDHVYHGSVSNISNCLKNSYQDYTDNISINRLNPGRIFQLCQCP